MFFLILSIIVTIFSIIASVFIIRTIGDIPVFRINSIKEVSLLSNSDVLIDSDTQINREDLKDYWQLTESALSFEEFLQINKDSISVIKNKILVSNQVQLPKIAKNECEYTYCYQRRLPFGQMPSVFWKGLIGIEDSRFLEHFGIDIKSIFRAIVTDIKEMRLAQGGSTLTQQLVKNLYYTNEKSFSRKIKEVIVAIYIETKFSKEDIISSYFNEVFWGSFNGIRIKGLYSASMIYFGKKPNEIEPYEASILISLLKGPYFYAPIKYTDRLKQRANVVFKKLISEGLFSSNVDNVWSEQEWSAWISELKERTLNNRLSPLAYISSQSDESKGLNFYEQFILVKSSFSVLEEISKRYPNEDLGMKIVMGNLKNKNLFTYYSKWERDKLKATSIERHSVGSTLKPLFYTLLSYFGVGWNDEVETGPVTLKLASGDWTPRESHVVSEEMTSVGKALQESLNRPLIRLAEENDFQKLEESSLAYLPTLKTPLAQYPGQLLGAIELSTFELFEVYKSLFNKECELVKSGVKSWDDTVLHVLSDPTKTTIRKLITANLSKLNFFGKTGTSNNGYDNWFVFYDGWNLGVIWTGVDSDRSGKGLKLYGGTTSFRVFQEFLLSRGRRLGELGCEKSEL
ncbi:transglycosylase domain-containing protein [Halobacteriovorax sp. HLS]|uniref:transglycosylase domain-containing protein n=1 Tax=Halobacteriovorax sp. HLS TaxID=2234000 RepID=UPI0013E2EEB7|nr:transglycosylase domain-containing protein [Halobacteriovorax sp. HLS]